MRRATSITEMRLAPNNILEDKERLAWLKSGCELLIHDSLIENIVPYKATLEVWLLLLSNGLMITCTQLEVHVFTIHAKPVLNQIKEKPFLHRKKLINAWLNSSVHVFHMAHPLTTNSTSEKAKKLNCVHYKFGENINRTGHSATKYNLKGPSLNLNAHWKNTKDIMEPKAWVAILGGKGPDSNQENLLIALQEILVWIKNKIKKDLYKYWLHK